MNGVTFKPGVWVIQDQWKWRRSIYHIWLSIVVAFRVIWRWI